MSLTPSRASCMMVQTRGRVTTMSRVTLTSMTSFKHRGSQVWPDWDLL